MPQRRLPHDPSLEHLRKQAKRLRHAVAAGDADAIARQGISPARRRRARTIHAGRRAAGDGTSYGFASWARLKRHLSVIDPFIWNPPPRPIEPFALACVDGRSAEVRARLAEEPSLLDKLGLYGRVALIHRAVERGQADGVRVIAGLGIDLNGMVPGTGFDRAPLHNAAGWGSPEMVTFLRSRRRSAPPRSGLPRHAHRLGPPQSAARPHRRSAAADDYF